MVLLPSEVAPGREQRGTQLPHRACDVWLSVLVMRVILRQKTGAVEIARYLDDLCFDANELVGGREGCWRTIF